MAGVRKLSALEAFELNIEDAHGLVQLAVVLRNGRARRMRREKRESLGSALSIPKKHWDGLDCVESGDVFVVLKPDSEVVREQFAEKQLEPLLRQAIVAAAAALETYVVDRVMELLSSALDRDELPRRLGEVPMSVRQHLVIVEDYQRKRWGVRPIVQQYVQDLASPSPSQIGKAFGVVGQDNLLRRLDKERRVVGGATARSLEDFCERRNRIAHSGDRSGRGRAAISVTEVGEHLDCVQSVVEALDRITG